MLIESFEHAEADFDARLLIDARNEAESVIHATEKSLRRPDFSTLEEDLQPGELQRIDEALAALKDAMAAAIAKQFISERTRSITPRSTWRR
jgi:molecular chaperone DnaK/molecular chaperone HscA